MDFVNCGIVQADSYYNPEVTTAVAAYNEGMDYIRRQMDKYAMFAAFSIAPLFPFISMLIQGVSLVTRGGLSAIRNIV